MSSRAAVVHVLLPAPGLLSHLAPGSGIVTTDPLDGPQLTVDYEGNLYGAENLARYADRVLHALGRHEARYPTVARRVVPREAVVSIGTFDRVRGQVVVHPSAIPALQDWLSTAEDLAEELLTSDRRQQMARYVEALWSQPAEAQRLRLLAPHDPDLRAALGALGLVPTREPMPRRTP